MIIKDIFGNEIKVTDLTAAWIEATRNVKFSEKAAEDPDHPVKWFYEFTIIKGIDSQGKEFGYSWPTGSDKRVTMLEYHQHNLNEINKLNASKSEPEAQAH